jgi:exodeoxyribonuclease V alpha subunit
MIASGRVVNTMNKNGKTFYLVKPTGTLSKRDEVEFKQEFYLLSGPVIKTNEYVVFPFSTEMSARKFQEVSWIAPLSYLSNTYMNKLMNSNLLSAIPKVERDKLAASNDSARFKKYSDFTPNDIMNEFSVEFKRATKILNQIKRVNALSMEFSLLHSLNVHPKSVDKLAEIISGSNGIQRVLEDPYSLASRNGMTFALCDLIGKAINIDPFNENRIKCAINDTINNLISNGNSAFNESRIVDATIKMLKYDVKHTRLVASKIKEVVHDLSDAGHAGIYSTHEMYEGDAYISQLVKQFAVDSTVDKFPINEDLIAKNLNVEQRQGIINAVNNRFSIITGGPGTGKTTVLKSVVAQFGDRALVLSAPTGKAARRISESSKLDASTLHSLLGFTPGVGFKFNKRNPLPYDLIVVDEFSMVDANMFRNLLDAIKPGARLVMVGDKDQLPSVDVGNVLSDLIDAKIFAVTSLTEVHRTALNSYITRAAISIRDGQMPDLRTAYSGKTDFVFLPAKDDIEIKNKIIDLMTKTIPEQFGVSMNDIQILTPQKNTEIGVDKFNEELRELVNPENYNKPFVRSMGDEFRVGDKVMQTKNNKELGINNGDVGFIKGIDYGRKTVNIDFDGKDADIPFDKLHTIKSALAITVHKSQGSEYTDVIIPMSMSHMNMLTRKLVYTAITRGKVRVWLVGDPKALEHAVKNRREIPRETALKYLLGGDTDPGNFYRPRREASTRGPVAGVPF